MTWSVVVAVAAVAVAVAVAVVAAVVVVLTEAVVVASAPRAMDTNSSTWWLTVDCTFAGGCARVGHRCTMW